MYDNAGHSFLNDSPAPDESFEERQRRMGALGAGL